MEGGTVRPKLMEKRRYCSYFDSFGSYRGPVDKPFQPQERYPMGGMLVSGAEVIWGGYANWQVEAFGPLAQLTMADRAKCRHYRQL
jgi:hypothetical protein